ncbi:class A beta-lactamase-related serine hydrolase [Virgibacillus necropolis]|uniref:serine hydrolase n=1 Tax=Virgibacillus necropolis TaxID=163877 RepID=UPI00384BACCC
MIFYIITILVVTLFLLACGFFWLRGWVQKPDADYVLKFIAKNPKRASLSVVRNGMNLVDFQSDQLRPLASTVKILVAFEYSQQAAQGEIDPDQQIKTDELARYYLPRTDGGAHEAWLKMMQEQELLQNGSVSLREVAKGMISHSSNANTEYLMMRLGLDRINANRERLKLQDHERVFPFVSSVFIPYEVAQKHGINIYKKTEMKKVKKLIEGMSQEAYIEEALKIHSKLNQDENGSYKEQVNLRIWHNMDFDLIASKRFVRSTTAEYISLVQKMNDLSSIAKPVREHLQPIMEWPMARQKNREIFQHLGGKGGSTAYIVTFAFYAEDKHENKTELAVFLNDVFGYETVKLSNSLSAFQLAIFTGEPHWLEKLSKFQT